MEKVYYGLPYCDFMDRIKKFGDPIVGTFEIHHKAKQIKDLQKLKKQKENEIEELSNQISKLKFEVESVKGQEVAPLLDFEFYEGVKKTSTSISVHCYLHWCSNTTVENMANKVFDLHYNNIGINMHEEVEQALNDAPFAIRGNSPSQLDSHYHYYTFRLIDDKLKIDSIEGLAYIEPDKIEKEIEETKQKLDRLIHQKYVAEKLHEADKAPEIKEQLISKELEGRCEKAIVNYISQLNKTSIDEEIIYYGVLRMSGPIPLSHHRMICRIMSRLPGWVKQDKLVDRRGVLRCGWLYNHYESEE